MKICLNMEDAIYQSKRFVSVKIRLPLGGWEFGHPHFWGILNIGLSLWTVLRAGFDTRTMQKTKPHKVMHTRNLLPNFRFSLVYKKIEKLFCKNAYMII